MVVHEYGVGSVRLGMRRIVLLIMGWISPTGNEDGGDGCA